MEPSAPHWWSPLLADTAARVAFPPSVSADAGAQLVGLLVDRLAALSQDFSFPATDLWTDVHDLEHWQRQMARVFVTFPLMPSVALHLADAWRTFVGEFVTRLDSDLPKIRAAFGGGHSLGAVVDLRTGLSDPHQGREVLLLQFASGVRVFYKPRPCSMDAALGSLFQWAREQGLPLVPTLPLVLLRDGYGWAEHIEATPCRSVPEVRQYYRQAGALAAFAFLLRGIDCTMDNLRATRGGPVMVDCETFFQPAVWPFGSARARREAKNRRSAIDFSIIETGLLPMVGSSWGGRGGDWSGFGDGQGAAGAPGANCATWEGAPQRPTKYADEIKEGFEMVARFVISHRADLLTLLDAPAFARGVVTRLIFRRTKHYAGVLQRLTLAESFRGPQERKSVVDALHRPYGDRAVPAEMIGPLLQAERTALESLDFPRFYTPLDRATLEVAGESIRDFFYEAPLADVRRQIERFDEADLHHQLSLIDAALLPSDIGLRFEAGREGEAFPWSPMAITLAHTIDALSIRHADGSVDWARPPFERPEDAPAPFWQATLYEGALGTALFLAAAQRAIGARTFQGTLDGVWVTVGKVLDQLEGPPDLGICHGLGSLVAGGLFVEALGGGARYAELADRAASLLPLQPDDAVGLDLFSGLAGGVVALLHAARRDDAWLERAAAYGRLLLGRCFNNGRWDPACVEGTLGLAHGAAGIGLALDRLHVQTGEAAFREGADAVFSFICGETRELTFWPRRMNEGCSSIRGWCHGAPGIIAALIASPNKENLQAPLTAALRAAMAEEVRYDHLCCGRCGRIEVLLAAAARTSDPSLADLASMQARQMVAEARAKGHFALRPRLAENLCTLPGLFRGLSGLGVLFLQCGGLRLPFSLSTFDFVPRRGVPVPALA